MANEPIYLTAEEAGILQAAVGRIVSDGIRVHDSDMQLPISNGNKDPVSPALSAFPLPEDPAAD